MGAKCSGVLWNSQGPHPKKPWTGSNGYRGNSGNPTILPIAVAKSSSQKIESCRANIYNNRWKAIYYFKSIPSCETSYQEGK